MANIVGKYVVDGIECEVKMSDHDAYVIVYSTVSGQDTPISGSQVKITKDVVKKIYSSASGGCQEQSKNGK